MTANDIDILHSYLRKVVVPPAEQDEFFHAMVQLLALKTRLKRAEQPVN